MSGAAGRIGSYALVAFGFVLAIGCSNSASAKPPGAATAHKQDAAPARVKVRTVSLELMPFGERTLSADADGGLVWGALTDLEGVEVCLWKQRPQLASFADFADVDGPCQTSGAGGKIPRFEGLPANSERVFRATKDGFAPVVIPFVTFEDDFVAPTLVSGVRNPMLRGRDRCVARTDMSNRPACEAATSAASPSRPPCSAHQRLARPAPRLQPRSRRAPESRTKVRSAS